MVYSKKDLKNILENVRTIAMVGASSNPDRDSFKVMKYLIEKGYKVFPVNPNEKTKIHNIQCYPNLSSIPQKIDMVDIFRSKETNAKRLFRLHNFPLLTTLSLQNSLFFYSFWTDVS